MGDKHHHPTPLPIPPPYHPPAHHESTGHKSYYDHFDDREQGNVLMRAEGAASEAVYSQTYENENVS